MGLSCGKASLAGQAEKVREREMDETENGAMAKGEAADKETVLAPKEKAPVDKIKELYASMLPSRRLLDAILKFCKDPHTYEEIDEEFEQTKKGEFTLYNAASLCHQLLEAGALRKIEEAPAEPKTVEIGGKEYLESAADGQRAEPRLQTTDDGRCHLEQEDSLAPFTCLIEEDGGRYRDVYRILLDCSSNEGGATSKQLSDAVDSNPELQEPRLYASYFFDRLSTCGLIEWTGSWHLTDLGAKAVAYLDGRD